MTTRLQIWQSKKLNLWGVEETAAFLRRSPGAIRHLVLRRKIPFRRVGGRICFLESEIISWVQRSPGKTLEELYAEEKYIQ
jgi:Helix-turn-helix domain